MVTKNPISNDGSESASTPRDGIAPRAGRTFQAVADLSNAKGWERWMRLPLVRWAAAISLLICACNSIGCKPANTYAPPPPPEVTVAHPIRKVVTRYLESTGTTEAYESVDLRARVPGFLDQVNFKPGAAVKKGDLLFTIDERTYQAAVDRAAAQVLADEAAYTAAESDARIADELFKRHAGSEIDKILKTGRRDSAKATVESSKAILQSAKLDLEFCEVRAPIDGRITKNFVDVGNLVGAAGQPTVLATLVNSHPIYVTVDASESDVLMVRRSRMAASPTAEPGQIAPGVWRPVDLLNDLDIVHGRIDYVDPALNRDTGTIRVRTRFENDNDLLLPGMFVRIRILRDTAESMLVPDIALLSDQAGRFALVVNDKNVVELRHVKIGALDGAMRVVLDGLSPTDQVIIRGLQRSRPDLPVKPTLAEIPNQANDAAGPTTKTATTPDAAQSKGGNHV
jgi:RND family efflux transporter MFP subunit